MDYTTSGLENCLSYLLLAIWYRLALERDHRRPGVFLALCLVAGLGVLNRMDTLLLFAPFLLLAFWPTRSLRRLGLVALGFAPFIAWELFALVYYGRLFPNTAYAKLNTGLPMSYYLLEGLRYYGYSLLSDPITVPAILGAFGAALWSRDTRRVGLAVGLGLYMLYVLRAGDFMSGRFFAAPLLCAVILWCHLPRRGLSARMRRILPAAACVVALGVGLAHPLSPLRTGAHYSTEILPTLQQHPANRERRGRARRVLPDDGADDRVAPRSHAGPRLGREWTPVAGVARRTAAMSSSRSMRVSACSAPSPARARTSSTSSR